MSNERLGGQMTELCGFIVDNQQYAVGVEDIQEIVRKQKTTDVPQSPGYINGLINLRGQIVTALNLRKLFGIEFNNESEHMNIIVEGKDALYSLVVDKVMDVFLADDRFYESTPTTLDEGIKKYVKGVYKLEKSLVMHLDIERILME
jgi:purine-binding chemotaxis protein CheW